MAAAGEEWGAGNSGSVSDANWKGTAEKPKETKDSNSGRDTDEGVGSRDLYSPLPPSQGNTSGEQTPALQVGSSNTETLLLQLVNSFEKLAASQGEKMEQKPYTFSSNTGLQPSAPPDPSLKYSPGK
uniref:Uncharacterized protein n=1 Tax=Strix occidentalis caurina TaxID=311401 RepID=A0A8D0FQN2_STROC